MLGSDRKKDIEINDPDYVVVTRAGEAFIAMFTISAEVVAFNMLIATMNHTYQNVMVNIQIIIFIQYATLL
jgi:hypothetical protein